MGQTFSERLDQVRQKLHDKGRVTYRALKREFDLDDDYLADIVTELIEAERIAADENGKVLVWAAPVTEQAEAIHASPQSYSSPPASYTPQHLAERIRAEQAAISSAACRCIPTRRALVN